MTQKPQILFALFCPIPVVRVLQSKQAMRTVNTDNNENHPQMTQIFTD